MLEFSLSIVNWTAFNGEKNLTLTTGNDQPTDCAAGKLRDGPKGKKLFGFDSFSLRHTVMMINIQQRCATTRMTARMAVMNI